ncbi:plasma-membrane calcium-translocating P-type ATPase/potassium and/or sodium efflux P-type ATPase,TIGR01523 [Arthrobacter subterraneus]|uniref:Plasma-membrane calcium-translocating P-type ATPase/potassium and/or sodium efflux P-type ATPase,TIGR01523 n=1 Tax=Arthrobacter subterraneus TaxID=335973 RepID=A0A1G8CQ58_9MICC|nr:cation-translocating P-type ATPase [Arthrobacter subterraneus]SDH47483.1 plasma-membrane calcium-translocating P-type ATPase/potassium and/or sodium efflux P-type ATPase,TIGR01523 [Arthrobacter subterraneus]
MVFFDAVRAPVEPTAWHLRAASDALVAFRVDPAAGLDSAEAERRLQTDGPNELRTSARVPRWRKILAQFQDPLIYLLLVAIAISLGAWAVEGATGAPIDAVVIAAVVLLNALLGLVQENKAENAVAALKSMTAATSTVWRDGELKTVPAAELVLGDILVLGEGDAVGADARLITATALRVSEASLTGESEAVFKDPATLGGDVPLGDRLNMVFKGTAVVQGRGLAVVTGTAMETEVGAIAGMLERTESEPTPLQKEIAGVSKLLGITVIVIAIVVMVTIVLVNEVSSLADLVTVLLLGVSLAVAAVPEGLPAILSVVLAIGVQRMARRNAVVKDLHSVETLGSASVIASDKTGTLTRNEMTIGRIVTASGQIELTGTGYRPEGQVLQGNHEASDPIVLQEASMVLAGGSFANNAQLTEHGGEWQIQGDPTEAAFLVAARKLVGVTERVGEHERQGEVPFTSERKLMSALARHKEFGELTLVTKGAPDVLLGRCTRMQVGTDIIPLDGTLRRKALADVEALSAQAFRTLAVAYRRYGEQDRHEAEVIDEADENALVYLGVAGIIDPPRAEAAVAVAEARRAGIRVVMITGDHPVTAARIASDLGISQPGEKAVTGARLDELDDAGLRAAAGSASVYARVSPHNKLQIIDAMQAQGNVVAMTGDGVNDAPALKSADIGIAMGITGTEVTKEASKMILGDDNFATIVSAVRQGRVIFDNIEKFLRYLLSSNMGEVFTVFLGVVFAGTLGLAGAGGEAVALPLLATQILWINLVTDSGPALAMGFDPEIDDVMSRPPRKITDRVLGRRMWLGILAVGLVMGIASLLTIDIFLPGGLVDGSDSLDVARTAGFTTLVLAQLFNAFNSRSDTTSAFHRLFVNKWLWGAAVLAVALQLAVVELPLLQQAFGTASLDAAHWAVCIGMASAVLWFDELRKLLYRSIRKNQPTAAPRG